MTPKHFFVSDLHLFSRRSHGDRYRESILSAAEQAKTFVLGGDIFDFTWSDRDSTEESVDEAIRWLRELLGHAPRCRVHFLLGNHDYHRLFIDRLDELAKTAANLKWHRFYVRLGNSLFLHGDVADRKMNSQSLARARSRWLTARQKGLLLNLIYDLAVQLRLPRSVCSILYCERVVARRILYFLDQIGEGPASGLKHVYFGHTHLALSNYSFDGLTFHNGGAPMKGFDFRIVESIIKE